MSRRRWWPERSTSSRSRARWWSGTRWASRSPALATQASQLVDRLVNIDEGPTEDSCSVPFLAKVGYVPVIGQALWRLTPDFAVKDSYENAFAPGYDLADGFPNPDQVVDDFRAMTYTSFGESYDAASDYVKAVSLDDRLSQTAVPLLSIFGTEDQICDPQEAQAAYQSVPGAQVTEIEGAGHSPNVEKPQETAALIEEFAIDAGDEALSPPEGADSGAATGDAAVPSRAATTSAARRRPRRPRPRRSGRPRGRRGRARSGSA